MEGTGTTQSQYAVIKAGGKQYNVSVGQRIRVNRIADLEKDSTYTISEVMVVGNGDTPAAIGTPYVAGAEVSFKVIGDCKGKKLVSLKRRRRKGYRRKIGHRQALTELLVENIKCGA